MSENASGGHAKTKAQDLFGILACMLGGFSAVSVFLAMEGQESKNLLARPVEGAMTLFGSPGALVVAAGLAVFGTILFLARRAIAPLRHLVGVFAIGLGVSLVVGGVRPSLAGLLGSALPEALPGIAGQVACFAIGVTVLVATIWVVWLAPLGSGRGSGAGSKPTNLTEILKPGTAERQSDGVSVAEARALQGLKPAGASGRSSALEGSSGPFSHVTKAKPIDVPLSTRPQAIAPPGASKPLSDPNVRPRAPAPLGNAPLPDVAAKRTASPVLPALERRSNDRRPDEKAAAGSPLGAPVLPLPSWESADEDSEAEALETAELDVPGDLGAVLDQDELDAEAELLANAMEVDDEPEVAGEKRELQPIAVDIDTDEAEEEELEERSLVLEEELDDPLADALDRIDVADEDLGDALEDAVAPAAVVPSSDPPDDTRASSARWEQVGLFDEEAEVQHEPPIPAEDAEESSEPAPPTLAASREDPEPTYVLTPPAERRAEPRPVAAARAEATAPELDTLTYEAGRLVLEQNRVAVSMLQKRFSLDFDQACEVLDRLQAAGLIGPYVGGRSREILLSLDEWESVAHA